MIASRCLRTVKFNPQNLVRHMGGGGHHGPLMPPFARLRPPSKTLPEEVELVWDDTVAPEATVDLDAPHVSSGTALKHFFLGFSFFVALYASIKLSEPEKRSPVAHKSAVLPKNGFLMDVGLASEEDAHDDEE